MLARNHRSNLTNRLSTILGVLHLNRRRQAAAEGSANSGPVNWAQTAWGRKFIKSATLSLAILCTASVALADVKITTRSANSGASSSYTTYIKGARQRTEGLGYTTIYQCDLKRTIQINDKTRTYMITPTGGGSTAENSPARNGRARKGGVITYHTTNTDTGERKQIFGMTAKRFKSRVVIEASEGACNSMNMEMETDGWFVDIPGGPSCPGDASSAPQMDQSGCVDEVRFDTRGVANMGQPVMTTTTIKFNAGVDGAAMNIPPSTSTQEVTDVSTVKLDQALFEIPAGYTEVKSTQELGSPY